MKRLDSLKYLKRIMLVGIVLTSVFFNSCASDSNDDPDSDDPDSSTTDYETIIDIAVSQGRLYIVGSTSSGIDLSYTDNGGSSFSFATEDMPVTTMNTAIFGDPSDSQTLFLIKSPSGTDSTLHLTKDSGSTYNTITNLQFDSNDVNPSGINWVVVDPNDSDTIFVGIHEGRKVNKTSNGGTSWVLLTESFDNSNGLGISFQDSDNLVITQAGLGVMSSNDGGNSWSESIGSGDFWDVFFVPDPASATVYIVRGEESQGVYKSEDSGAVFVIKNTGISVAGQQATYWNYLAIKDANSLVASIENIAYYTDDGADTWTEVTNGIGKIRYESTNGTFFGIKKSTDGNLNSNKLIISTDGVTWAEKEVN